MQPKWPFSDPTVPSRKINTWSGFVLHMHPLFEELYSHQNNCSSIATTSFLWIYISKIWALILLNKLRFLKTGL